MPGVGSAVFKWVATVDLTEERHPSHLSQDLKEASEFCAQGTAVQRHGVRVSLGYQRQGWELTMGDLAASVRTLAFTLNEVGSHWDILGTIGEIYKLYIRHYLINIQIRKGDNS